MTWIYRNYYRAYINVSTDMAYYAINGRALNDVEIIKNQLFLVFLKQLEILLLGLP